MVLNMQHYRGYSNDEMFSYIVSIKKDQITGRMIRYIE